MRTKELREFKQGLVSYEEEYRTKLNYKQDNSICWTVEEIWLRVWERGITHMVFYVRSWHWSCWCWLLLITADCWWIKLVAGWFLVAAGILLVAASCFCFLDVDDFRLRQFCRRKSLWIFSKRQWRNLAKTSFKIVLEYFEEAMKEFGKDKF